jgi:hypothetical protein
VKKTKLIQKEAELQGDMEVEIEFVCPVRGLVKQKVKGLKFKSLPVSTPRFTADELVDMGNKSIEEDN